MMNFEYDQNKSVVNQHKHGIDFEQAQEIWNDAYYLEIPVYSDDEKRFLVIGMIENKHWSAVITYRGIKVRIISVRRSRREEVTWYESEEF